MKGGENAGLVDAFRLGVLNVTKHRQIQAQLLMAPDNFLAVHSSSYKRYRTKLTWQARFIAHS
jgi:hypothetical protein